LRRAGDGWQSTSACRCGFVRMLGAFAGPQAMLRLGDQESPIALVADGRTADTKALHAALTGPVTDVPAGLEVSDQAELGDLDLWLTISQPDLDRLTVLSPSPGWARAPQLLPLGGLAAGLTEPARLAIAAVLPGAGTGPSAAVSVRGYGPGGPALAERLAARAQAWDELGRPGAPDIWLEVFPAAVKPHLWPGATVLERPNATITVGWPGWS
jgi:protein-L-isoaspartate(D-aspartate) O-methyltransferase